MHATQRQGVKQRLASFFSARLFWRLLTASAIIFAAGISGAWLSLQIHAPLPPAWGWFGALIAGTAVFGGVLLGVQGHRAGWAFVLIGAAAEVTFDYHYFLADHGQWVAVVISTFPTMIALAGGFVEATLLKQEKAEAEQDEELEREQEHEQRAWERKQEELERERQHRLELERIRADKEAQIAAAKASRPTASELQQEHRSPTKQAKQTNSTYPVDANSGLYLCPNHVHGCPKDGNTPQAINAHIHACKFAVRPEQTNGRHDEAMPEAVQ